MVSTNITPQGYLYGKEPKATNPFWGNSEGDDAIIFTPHVEDIEGGHRLSWTNNGGLENPETIDILDGADGTDGTNGTDGITPSISASATVDDTTETPEVSVTKSGTDAAPSFLFAFTGLKGAQGERGERGVQGETGENGMNGTTFSPHVEDIEGGHRLSWTNNGGLENPETIDILDGADGTDGTNGTDGITPSISASATVDDTTGTPEVSVTKSGTDAAPSFLFAFTGLKGADGGGDKLHKFIPVTETAYTYRNAIKELIGVDYDDTLYNNENIYLCRMSYVIDLLGGNIQNPHYIRVRTFNSSDTPRETTGYAQILAKDFNVTARLNFMNGTQTTQGSNPTAATGSITTLSMRAEQFVFLYDHGSKREDSWSGGYEYVDTMSWLGRGESYDALAYTKASGYEGAPSYFRPDIKDMVGLAYSRDTKTLSATISIMPNSTAWSYNKGLFIPDITGTATPTITEISSTPSPLILEVIEL